MRITYYSFMFNALMVAVPAITQAADNTSPADLVKKVSEDIFTSIKSDTTLQNDSKKLNALVNTHLAPYFDFTRITQLAMGKNWHMANPAQQKELINQFKTLLIHTYSNVMVTYRNQNIEYLPFRNSSTNTDAVVRTRVSGGNKGPVTINYTLTSTPKGWKAYDVTVDGVSLVTNYRDEFNSTIQEKGVDGLIAFLKQKNENSASKTQ